MFLGALGKLRRIELNYSLILQLLKEEIVEISALIVDFTISLLNQTKQLSFNLFTWGSSSHQIIMGARLYFGETFERQRSITN